MDVSRPNELVIYTDAKSDSPVHIAFDGETMWLTQEQIAALFETTSQNVGQHNKNIYEDSELDASSTSKKIFGVVENRPNYGVLHYKYRPCYNINVAQSAKFGY